MLERREIVGHVEADERRPASSRSRAPDSTIASGLGTCSSTLLRCTTSKRPRLGAVSALKNPSTTSTPRLRACAAACRDGSTPSTLQPRACRGLEEESRPRADIEQAGGVAGSKALETFQPVALRQAPPIPGLRPHGRGRSAFPRCNRPRDRRVRAGAGSGSGTTWRKPQTSQAMMS